MLKDKAKSLVILVLGLAICISGAAALSYDSGAGMACYDGANCTYQEAEANSDEPMVGGLVHNQQETFDAGIAVNGTEVISSARAISAAALSASGAFTVLGETSVEGFTAGAGALQLATSTGTTGITQAQMLADNYFEIMVNTGATASIQLPASSTMTTLIPNVGDNRRWLIHNATSTTMAMTILAGTGMDLIGVTTNDDIIDATEYSILDCYRQPDTDITCRISEELHVD